jgi:hypothetical protein
MSSTCPTCGSVIGFGKILPFPTHTNQTTGWNPIETAPKDNKIPLYLARFVDGNLTEIDFDGSWESESESWEIPQVYHFWGSASGIEEPTHWMYPQPIIG